MAYLPATERRRDAVAAARRILERDGLRAVTLRRVAEEAGMTLSSLQWAVRSKDGLLRELFATINAEIAEITAAAAAPVVGLEPAIRAVLGALWATIEQAPMMEVGESELVIAALRDPAGRPEVQEMYESFVASCARALVSATARAEESLAVPAERVARLMVVALEGLVMLYLADGDAPRCRADLGVLAGALAAVASGATPVGA